MSKLVHGIGFNDRKYPAEVNNNPQNEYNTWQRMLERCKEKCWVKHPTYIDTNCSENFKSYSFFYEWCQEQVGFGNKDNWGRYWHLDKDLLIKGNKIYSEDTCVFVPQKINSLLTKCNSSRGEYPIGVSWHKASSKFNAVCSNGHSNQKYLGLFSTVEEAFSVYKTFKEGLIKEIATEHKEQLDHRVYNALMCYEVNIND